VSPAPRPPAEVDVTASLARALLTEQHPSLADRALRPLAEGWDNVLYRLGDDLVVRLPRRAVGAALVAHELRWLPVLAPRLPLPVPEPVAVGGPSEALAYPWSWLVVPWFPGASAVTAPIADGHRSAERLGRFVAALRRPAPEDAPTNPYRSIPLAGREALTRDAIAALDRQALGGIDPAELARAWEALAAVPGWSGPAQWLHADLHAGNVIVDRGSVAAVVDFGDLCGGDPAVDLMAGWFLFDDRERATFRTAAEVPDDDTWRRSAGWALAISVSIAAHTADDDAFAAAARRTIARVFEGRHR
jgi:aminoglycoside phosphotransferase (APT) family kinase protein